jgi:hypothetical protein
MTFSGDAFYFCSGRPSTALASACVQCTHPENRTGKVTWSTCVGPKAAL